MRNWCWVLAFAACAKDKEPPKPSPVPSTPTPVPETKPPVDDPPQAAAPSMRTSWMIESISLDKKRALLLELAMGDSRAIHYRVVTIATNKVEADVALPTISALPYETINDDNSLRQVKLELDKPAIADELRSMAPVLMQFPLGAVSRFAATADGKHMAFNAGDWIYTADDGKVGTRVAKEASYQPWFTPDGKTLFFHRINGMIDGVVGKYELFVTSIDGTQPPKRLAGTAGPLEGFGLTDQNTVRIVVSREPKIPTCVVEVGLAAPYPVKKLACFKEHEKIMGCRLSAKGAWVACNSSKELPELDPNSTTKLANGKVIHNHKLQFRIRTMEVATGKLGVDRVGFGTPSAISDDGLLVMEARGQSTKLEITDAHGNSREVDAKVEPGLFSNFISPTEVVVESNGNLHVVDVKQ